MKKIGILGGLGPESTVEYYKGIIHDYKKLTNDENFPQIFINSINMTEIMNYLGNDDTEKLVNVLSAEINKLEKSGADFIAIASNTPHCVIDQLMQRASVPIISIVEETCKYAQKNKLKRILLTGTIFTMKKDFYIRAFQKNNIECIVPDDKDKEIIKDIIFLNLENGIILEKDKNTFKELCNKIIRDKNIDGLVLGCTELPLLVNQKDFNIPVLDTMDIHINSILEKLIGGDVK